MKAKYIYEKFIKDSDPVKDLGIGAYIKEFNEISDEDPHSNPKLAVRFFGDNYLYSAEVVFNILKYIVKDNLDVQSAYELAYKQLIIRYRGGVAQSMVKHNVTKYFKDKFGVDLKSDNLNEKFTQHSDPVHDLRIGIPKELKENYTLVTRLTGVNNQERKIINDFFECEPKDQYFLGSNIHQTISEGKNLSILSRIIKDKPIKYQKTCLRSAEYRSTSQFKGYITRYGKILVFETSYTSKFYIGDLQIALELWNKNSNFEY